MGSILINVPILVDNDSTNVLFKLKKKFEQITTEAPTYTELASKAINPVFSGLLLSNVLPRAIRCNCSKISSCLKYIKSKRLQHVVNISRLSRNPTIVKRTSMTCKGVQVGI